MEKWIDFKELRASLCFESVLEYYRVQVKRRGHQHYGPCPLPGHNGKRKSASFSAQLDRGVFQCFGCGAKGNILEFAAFMEGIDPNDKSGLRKIAEKLRDQFSSGTKPTSDGDLRVQPKPTQTIRLNSAKTQDQSIINKPLDFELKGLDGNHPYLLGRGFTPATIKQFGLGFCSRGLLKDRIAIPLHDAQGNLIGYAGRVIEDNQITDSNPRYLFPGERKRDSAVYSFRKTLFLYNGFRIESPVEDLIVVEGFASVWWLTQHGFLSVVATMGADSSEKQAELIVSVVKAAGRVWLASDGDDAGVRHAQELFRMVSPHRFVRWVRVSDKKQPTDFSQEQLRRSFLL